MCSTQSAICRSVVAIFVRSRSKASSSAVGSMEAPSELWTRLRCSRCRYVSEHPGPVELGDLDRECGLGGAPLGAVTVYRVSEPGVAEIGKAVYRVLPHEGAAQ